MYDPSLKSFGMLYIPLREDVNTFTNFYLSQTEQLDN
jgi:hypothetical protein